MIERDVAGAAGRRFDLLVVGGGVLGAWTALLASANGLETALVEREDFGGGATWNGMRILHGGLRSLQRLALGERHAAATESAWLRDAFPELIEPLDCVLPLDGRGTWRPAAAAAALAAERALAGWAQPAARPRLVEAGELRGLHPGAGRATAGLLWRDALLPRPGRLVIETLRWAIAAGATTLSRVEALRLLVAGGRVEGIAARDRLRDEPLELRADAVAWCAGAGCPAATAAGGPAAPPEVLGFNLLLARELPAGRALAVRARGGPALFLVPLEGATLAGTRYVAGGGAPSERDIESFLAELAAAAPFLSPDGGAVLRVLAGRQPAAAPGATVPATRAVHHDHGRAGGPRGLLCAWPAKLTTARREAARVLRALAPGAPARLPPRPASRAVPGAADATRLAGTDPAALRAIAAAIAAEECVLAADDLLLRRTEWALDPRRRPGLEAALSVEEQPALDLGR